MSSSCCSPDHSCSTGASAPATKATAVADVADAQETVYKVAGVNSAHCSGVVTEALNGLGPVLAVDAGVGTGLVTVTTDGEPDDALVERTIQDAGYSYAGRA